uniref:VWFC domain-containing protein n=1 Tax=Octopus bimaculoides TaxID=37653 RepID=A0A0L8H645_OCTBM
MIVHNSLPKKFCTYKGHEYRIAQVFLGDDGCSKCSCPASGEVTCVKQTCVIKKEVVTTTSAPFCVYNGFKYNKNEEFAGIDGCSKCSCTESGVVACIKQMCSELDNNPAPTPQTVCIYNEHTYQVEEEFEGADGCSKCQCSGSGLVTCVKQVCSKSRNGEESRQKKSYSVCRYNGQIYIFGQTFTAVDNCNQCGCKANGNIVCTKTICPATTTQVITVEKGDTSAVCRYHGKVYIFGQTFISIDKCNQCSCRSKGKVECTQKICSSQGEAHLLEITTEKFDLFAICHYNGHVYIFGQTFPSVDKCNQCSCKSKGVITCSKRTCPPPRMQATTKIDIKVECRYNGKIFVFGQTFIAIDKCNHCICKFKGKISCTKEKCQETTTQKTRESSSVCRYNGQVYIIGQIFVAIDKCNRCSCKPEGIIICTKQTCSSPQKEAYLTESGERKLKTFAVCRYNGRTYVFGETFTAEDKCNECSCKRKGAVICTKKPVCSPSISEISVKCHYNGKTYNIGVTFDAADKCNKCTCKAKGNVDCTTNICVFSEKHEISVKCKYGTKIYIVGETFPATDNCNKCSCKSKGIVECTKSICLSTGSQETTTHKIDIFAVCHYYGHIYIFGQTFKSVDRCNQCSCQSKGNTVCTKKKCTSMTTPEAPITLIACHYNGKVYKFGQTFAAIDKCNQCACMTKGSVMCTKKICFSKTIQVKTECYYNGKVYIIGQTFIAIDKCNECTCKPAGAVMCTEEICPLSKTTVTKIECHYNGKVYIIGQTFIAIDKCNQCTCRYTGSVICTEKICPPSETTVTKIECRYYGKVYVIGQTFIAIDKCNQCTCKYTGAVVCTEKICSISKTSVTKVECHYYGKVYVIGQTFIAIDNCNQCICKFTGDILCTEKTCPLSKTTVTKIECRYYGKVYVTGQTFIAIDNCNQCICKFTGDILCTEKTCPLSKTTGNN